MKWIVFRSLGILLLPAVFLAADAAVTVELDVSQAPELQAWCNHAKTEMLSWHPRISEILASDGFVPPGQVKLTVRKTDEGVGGTAGTSITISSGWVSKHPEDTGMVIHELVHVIQRYPSPNPGWITEGIADYIRWALYERKPLTWFPVPQEPLGYTSGYRGTAGFLLWLESGPAPGIVRSLNTAMRNQTYHDRLFETVAGRPLPDLWAQYVEARR
jgi:hypothetical protein